MELAFLGLGDQAIPVLTAGILGAALTSSSACSWGEHTGASTAGTWQSWLG